MTYLRVGDQVGGRYTVRALLGEGGMGSVYLVTDDKLGGKKRAMKQSLQPFGDDLLVREADLLSSLHHPALPELIDLVPPGGIADKRTPGFMIMDFVEGSTLHDWLTNRGTPLDPEQVAVWALELCDCFAYLHSVLPEPIIYRDLKPSNVMIDVTGRLRLIDFGISRRHNPDRVMDTMPFGTIGFASPEQLQGIPTDTRSDLYMLGAMMYYLLTAGKHYTDTQMPIDRLVPDLPPKMATCIHKLLASDPNERYQSAQQTKQELTELAGDAHAKNLPTKTKTAASATPRLILVGGIAPGSGSSLSALSLSCSLSRLNVPHTLMEHPLNDPAFALLLHSERRKPVAARSMLQFPGYERPFQIGQTSHLWLDPQEENKAWQDVREASRQTEKPLCILDVSNHWFDSAVQELVEEAEMIYLVADPYPPRFNSHSARRLMTQAMRWKQAGKQVKLVANRYAPIKPLKTWLNAFPWKPDVVLGEWLPGNAAAFYEKGRLRSFPGGAEQELRSWGRSMRQWEAQA